MAFVLMSQTLVAAAAGTDVTVELGEVPVNFSQNTFLVARMALVSPALLTGATATQIVFTFQNRRAGSVIGTMGTVTTATGTNLPAGTPVAAVVGAQLTVLAGDALECVLTHASTGTAYGAIVAKVELQ